MKQVKFLLIVLIASMGCTSYAQYFSNLYIQGRPSMLFGSIQQLNGKLYVTGVTSTVRSPYYSKALYGKIGDNGNVDSIISIIDSNNYSYDIYSNALKKTADGNFIATGDKTDSIQRAFIAKFDTAGNILLWREYTDTTSSLFEGMDIAEIPGKGYLLAVNIDIGQTSYVLIIRTDTSGNVLNEKNFSISYDCWPWVIRPMYNGHYLVGAWSGPLTDEDTPYICHTWLIEVDSMGNEVRNWLDPDPTNLWPNGMEQTADSGWIIVRQHLDYDLPAFQAYDGSILKLDKNFNKQWEIDTGGISQDGGMYDVKILSDRSYICVGANPIDNFIDSTSNIYGWLMKVSQTGQIIWQRFYLKDSSYEADEYLNSVALMPDGGFVACGQIQNNNGQQGWIIRTDSMGCLLDNCGREFTSIDNIPQPATTIKCYPNPFTNELDISIAQPNLTQADFSICNILGQTVYTQHEANLSPTYTKMLDLSYLPNGVYLVEVVVDGEVRVKEVVKQ